MHVPFCHYASSFFYLGDEGFFSSAIWFHCSYHCGTIYKSFRRAEAKQDLFIIFSMVTIWKLLHLWLSPGGATTDEHMGIHLKLRQELTLLLRDPVKLDQSIETHVLHSLPTFPITSKQLAHVVRITVKLHYRRHSRDLEKLSLVSEVSCKPILSKP